MNTLVVFAHPSASSFNHAMLDKVLHGLVGAGHKVRVKDLYAENFSPVLQGDELSQLQNGTTPARISTEQADVLWADSLIFIYPLWWFGPPAILKGWLDSVLSYGFAFKHHEGNLCGLLTHSKALVLITAGSSKNWFKEQNAEDIIYRPITQGTLEFCGVSNVSCNVFFNLSEKTDIERTAILNGVHQWGEDWDSLHNGSEKKESNDADEKSEEGNGALKPLISQAF